MALSWEKIPASEFKSGNSLFQKRGTGYHRVEKETTYNASRMWGIKPDTNKNWDNEFAQAIADVPEGSTIYVPGGSYHADNTLEVRRNVSIIGDNNATKFIGAHHNPVWYIGPGARGASFERFVNTHLNKDNTLGLLPDGTLSKHFADYAKGSGMMIQGVVHLHKITGMRLSGAAFYVFGALGHNGTDVSNMALDWCYAYENRGSGLVVDGPDANFMNITRFSASDNDLYGIDNSSFLGLTVNGFMSHYNKGGAIMSPIETARSHFYGVYDEEGGTPSYLSSRTFVSGFLGSGFTGEGMYQEGSYMYGQQRWGQMKFANDAIHFGSNVLRRRDNGIWGSAFNDDPGNITWGFVDNGGAIKASRDKNNYPDGRKVEHGGLIMDVAYLGGRRRGAIGSRYFLKEMAFTFVKGDYFDNSEPNGRNPIKWVCVKGGWGDSALFKAYGNGSGLFQEAPVKELLPIDAGWQYYATDHKKNYIWTGSELTI